MIPRDLKATLEQQQSPESLLLWEPRQVGKTTLLDQMNPRSSAILDDLHLRTEAQNDPAFFLEKLKLPCLIDEGNMPPIYSRN